MKLSRYLSVCCAIAVSCLASDLFAQEFGIIEAVYFAQNETVLVGQLDASTNLQLIDTLEFDGDGGESLMFVDSATGQFMIAIESMTSLSIGLNSGQTSSGASLMILLPPNAPRRPLAGGDTPQHPDSVPISPTTPDGTYIYVMDECGVVHILPHQNHNHPEVLGGDQPATGAGEVVIDGGVVTEINNLSGHFQFHPDSLWMVRWHLEDAGIDVADGAENPWTGGY